MVLGGASAHPARSFVRALPVVVPAFSVRVPVTGLPVFVVLPVVVALLDVEFDWYVPILPRLIDVVLSSVPVDSPCGQLAFLFFPAHIVDSSSPVHVATVPSLGVVASSPFLRAQFLCILLYQRKFPPIELVDQSFVAPYFLGGLDC